MTAHIVSLSQVSIRLYEHARARVEGNPDVYVDAHGWDHATGDQVDVDGVAHTLTEVGSHVHTGDVRGDYVVATAEVRS